MKMTPEQALETLEMHYNRESLGYEAVQVLREALAMRLLQPELTHERIDKMAEECGFNTWAEWPEYRDEWQRFARMAAASKLQPLVSEEFDILHAKLAPKYAMNRYQIKQVAFAVQEMLGIEPPKG